MDEVVAGEGAGSEADNAPASAGVAAVAAIAALIAVDGCGGVFVGVVVDGPGGGDRRADEEKWVRMHRSTSLPQTGHSSSSLICRLGCGCGTRIDGEGCTCRGRGGKGALTSSTDLYLDAEGIAGKVPLWPPELNRCPRGRGTPAAEEDEPPAGGGGSTEVVE
ncbi:hypothetical protein LTR39_000354 [Cryomyces antarcticus]|nr:hypothetical protein LTR39_000354 [Cryomyces antarcticus]